MLLRCCVEESGSLSSQLRYVLEDEGYKFLGKWIAHGGGFGAGKVREECRFFSGLLNMIDFSLEKAKRGC